MYILKEYTESQLPAASEAISQGLDFCSKIEQDWNTAKRYDDVQTYNYWDNENQFWAARISRHADLTYSQMLETIMHNHTENEAQYIPLIDSFQLLDSSKDGQWLSRRVHYRFPFPLKNRDMDIWLTSKETIPGTQFINVSIPRKLESAFVKGMYLSVEIITKLEDGRIEWTLATTSEAGGWLPQFLQRPQMTKAVAQDVPEFRTWVNKYN